MSDGVRRTILDATDKASAHFSFKKTSVEDIARAAGIGKGTIVGVLGGSILRHVLSGPDAADEPAEQATFDVLVTSAPVGRARAL